ncbi:hypothetical protein NKH77_50810 [Streptomyces sp. M19]
MLRRVLRPLTVLLLVTTSGGAVLTFAPSSSPRRAWPPPRSSPSPGPPRRHAGVPGAGGPGRAPRAQRRAAARRLRRTAAHRVRGARGRDGRSRPAGGCLPARYGLRRVAERDVGPGARPWRRVEPHHRVRRLERRLRLGHRPGALLLGFTAQVSSFSVGFVILAAATAVVLATALLPDGTR